MASDGVVPWWRLQHRDSSDLGRLYIRYQTKGAITRCRADEYLRNDWKSRLKLIRIESDLVGDLIDTDIITIHGRREGY